MTRLLKLLGENLTVSTNPPPAEKQQQDSRFHPSSTSAGLLENSGDRTGLINDLGMGTILVSCIVGIIIPSSQATMHLADHSR